MCVAPPPAVALEGPPYEYALPPPLNISGPISLFPVLVQAVPIPPTAI